MYTGNRLVVFLVQINEDIIIQAWKNIIYLKKHKINKVILKLAIIQKLFLSCVNV